ncbi:MAG: hypothetical protein R2844_00740 [Caldilineales bacterium]
MLPGGQEGHAGEKMGVPERELPGGDRLAQERLPDEVLQHQVAEQLVVGNANAVLAGQRRPRLELKQVVGRDQGLAAQNHGGKPNQRRKNQHRGGQDGAPVQEALH